MASIVLYEGEFIHVVDVDRGAVGEWDGQEQPEQGGAPSQGRQGRPARHLSGPSGQGQGTQATLTWRSQLISNSLLKSRQCV